MFRPDFRSPLAVFVGVLSERVRRLPGWLSVALMVSFAGLFVLMVLNVLFPPKIQLSPEEFSAVVTDREGYPLYAELSKNDIWRYPVDIDSVSPVYIETLLAYEDRWFYYHPGINPLAMIRAAIQNLWSKDVISGASTLTMQVARLMHPYEQRVGEPIWRRIPGKLYQILRAFQLEFYLSKQQILALYINTAPFGGVIEGVEAASYSYLQKSAGSLTDAEAAMLAAMPQAPSRYRPDRYPQVALQARNKIIERMVTQGDWTRERADMALMETVESFVWKRPSLAPLLSQRLINEQKKQGDQLEIIHSTVQSGLQAQIEQLLKQYANTLPEPVSAAVMLLDNQTMEVMAYAGSADYLDKKRFGYVDMIQAIRSPGSTLKPFLFAKAVDEGIIHSASLMVDADRTSKSYRPANFDRGFNGPVSASQALQWSLNVPAVNLLETYGAQRFTSELKNAGLTLSFPGNSQPNLAMILGGVGTNMESLMQAYAALGRGGKTTPINFQRLQPVSRSNAADSEQTQLKETQRYLVSEGAAWIVYKILESQLRPGEIARMQMNGQQDFAWKTGTSYGYRDAWAFAVNKAYTIGVWVGRPDGTPSPGQYGAQTAAPVVFQIMDMLQSTRVNRLPQPDNVSQTSICWPLGGLSEKTPEAFCHEQKQAWILDAVIPPTANLTSNFESQGAQVVTMLLAPERDKRTSRECHPNAVQVEFALWPIEAEPWLARDQRRSTLFPEADQDCNHQAVQTDSIDILFPEHGEKFIHHIANENTDQYGAQPVGKIEIPVIATSNNVEKYWYVNGEHWLTQKAGLTATLSFKEEGLYRIQVFTETAESRMIEIEVGFRQLD